MMNSAVERHGREQRLDVRSWANQGRDDLAELVEPKLLAGSEAEARQLHAHVDGLREQRAELPAPHLPWRWHVPRRARAWVGNALGVCRFQALKQVPRTHPGDQELKSSIKARKKM